MKIRNGMQVSIVYKLLNDDGEVLDENTADNPMTFVQGQGEIIRGLEEYLLGEDLGFRGRVTIKAEKAYGHIDPSMIFIGKSENFPAEMEIFEGMEVQTEGPDGPMYFKIKSIDLDEDEIILDGNHPLAGQDLTFEIEVVDVQQN